MPIRTLHFDTITSPSGFAVLDQLAAQHRRRLTGTIPTQNRSAAVRNR